MTDWDVILYALVAANEAETKKRTRGPCEFCHGRKCKGECR